MISETPVSVEDLFTCQNCGECCQGFGGTYVSPKNIKDIALYLDLPVEHVQETYCRPSGKKLVIAQKVDGYCVFWDKHCTIHPVKPRMCRAWPFINNILLAPGNWRLMATACPGIKPEVPESVLLACVRRELARIDTQNEGLPQPTITRQSSEKQSS